MISQIESTFNPIAVVVTAEDYQKGAMIEALGFLERGYVKQAQAVLITALTDPDFSLNSKHAQAMIQAENWIGLGLPSWAELDLKHALKL